MISRQSRGYFLMKMGKLKKMQKLKKKKKLKLPITGVVVVVLKFSFADGLFVSDPITLVVIFCGFILVVRISS